MAKKLNRNLIGGLALFGMLLVGLAGFALLRSLPGHDPKVYEAQAKELQEKGELDRAAQTFMRAFQRDPQKNPEYLIMAARCYEDMGLLQEVRSLISEARKKDPMLKSASEMSVGLEMEVAKMVGGTTTWTRVKEEADKLLEINEQSPTGKAALGIALANLRGDDERLAEQALAVLREAWKLDPGNASVVEALVIGEIGTALGKLTDRDREDGKRLVQEGETIISQSLAAVTDKATKDYSNLKRMEGLYKALTATLPGMRDDARLAEGVSLLEQLASSDTVSCDAALTLANLKLGLSGVNIPRDVEGAERAVRSAIERFPKDGRPYLMLGQILQMKRSSEQDLAKRLAMMGDEAKVFQDGLANVARAKAFKKQMDNFYRVLYFRELTTQELDKSQIPGMNEADRNAAMAKAEEWINKLKAEEDPQSLVVRTLTAALLNVRGDTVQATAEAEAADRLLGAAQDLQLQLLLADLYFRQQQWGNARKSLERALASRRDLPLIYVRLAQAHLAMNDATTAIQYLNVTKPESVRNALETSQFAIQLRVEAYRQLNQLALAQEWSSKLRDEGPAAALREARLMISAKRMDEAEAKLKEILKTSPPDVDAVRLLVQLYRDTERDAEARSLVDEMAKGNPDMRVFQGMKIALTDAGDEARDAQMIAFIEKEQDALTRETMLADFYLSRQKWKDAMARLDAAEALQPKNPGVIDRQFRAAVLAQDWDRANKYVLKDGELNLDGSGGRIGQGRLALAKGEGPKAVELMRAGLAVFPSNSMGWTYLAEAYIEMGNRSEARTALARALEINPTNGFANRAMAELALREGDEASAEKYLEAASRVMQEEPWVKRQVQIMKEKDNPEQGIASRERVRKEEPKNLENLVLLARLYAHAKVAQFDKATEVYREALEVSKNDLALAKEFAAFLARDDVNRPAEGDALLVGLLRNAEKDRPMQAKISVALGQFCEAQKQFATADRHFRFAVERDPSPGILNACGEFYARTNRHKEAAEYYKRLCDVAKDDARVLQETRGRLCALYLAMGDLDEAKVNIDDYVKQYPNEAQGLIYLGAFHRIGGDIQKAKDAFDRLLEKQPDNATALWQRGQLNMLQGRWQAALDDLQKAKAYSPRDFFFQHRIMLAQVLLELDQGAAAITELKSILSDEPGNELAIQALVDAYCTMRPPRFQEAENQLLTVMRERPKDYQWPMMLGRVAEREASGKSPEEIKDGAKKAAKAYEQAAELSRYRAETVSALFRVCKHADNPQAIISYADSRLSTKLLMSMPPELAMVGWAYSRVGQRERCLERFDQAMSAAGQDFLVYSKVVNEMINALGKDETLKRVRAQAEASPENIDKQKALVHMLHADQKPDDAIALCDRIFKLAVRNEDKLFSLVGAGMLLEQLKRYEDAKAKYEEALKIDSNEPTALNNLAYLLVDRLNRPAEALPYAEQVNRIHRRSNANVLDTLGWIQAQMGKLREAAGTLLRALEIDRDNIAAQYHLGVIHKRLGEREEAIARLKSAKKAIENQQSEGFAKLVDAELRELGAGAGS
ncbi:tetratricopeptide repeat protein [Phycisphaerae bacterium RAS2]|nr:tetratricopeptide repeat protein [Phycisphaerae bacterium RAS2]